MPRLAYDFTLGKPGCALLQAAFDGNTNPEFGMDFPSDTWLIELTPNMRVYELNDDQYLYLTLISKLVADGMTVQGAKIELRRQAQEGP